MIQFTDQQIAGFTPEEKEMFDNLVKRHHVEVLTDEEKRHEEEQQAVKEYVKEHFARERENEEFTKRLEAQLDTSGHITTTQFF